MNRKLFGLLGVLTLVAVATALGQQAGPIPAASQAEIDCSGFISVETISSDLYVLNGADNDLQEFLRLFSAGDIIYLRSRTGELPAVGTEYRILRPGTESRGLTSAGYRATGGALFSHAVWYSEQQQAIRSLGHPYEDAGRAKVFADTPQGALAEVTYACGMITVNDIAVPFKPRPVPQYSPTGLLDRFALPNGKLVGAITAAHNNAGALSAGDIAYLNLGSSDGVQPGQVFRAFKIFRDFPAERILAAPIPPREIVGELVILWTQEKSSVAIVTKSIRDISLGDGVELQ